MCNYKLDNWQNKVYIQILSSTKMEMSIFLYSIFQRPVLQNFVCETEMKIHYLTNFPSPWNCPQICIITINILTPYCAFISFNPNMEAHKDIRM